jgi:hypothetical protein
MLLAAAVTHLKHVLHVLQTCLWMCAQNVILSTQVSKKMLDTAGRVDKFRQKYGK